jgi:hypothetical protein
LSIANNTEQAFRQPAAGESPDDPDYGLVILRNILASPRFKRAAQRVTRVGDEREVAHATST